MKRTIHFVGYLLQVSVCSHRYVESEYYTTGEEFWAEDDGAGYGRTVHTWIWGPDVPGGEDTSLQLLDLRDRYPDHGFIQLSSRDGKSLSIDLVKRPPPTLYPMDESFCRQLLPVAIGLFLGEHGWPVKELNEIEVVIDSKYSYTRACKCYTEVMIDMGFNVINSIIRGESAGEDICEIERPFQLTGSLSGSDTAKLSPRSQGLDGLRLLQSAQYITSDRRE